MLFRSACSAFAGALSDYMFGKDAPVTKHQNFNEIKVGDIIDLNNSETGYGHAIFVTGIQPTTSDSFEFTNGNSGGKVNWGSCGYVSNWSKIQLSESYVYSRY